jgi:hypothetical protein
MVFLKENGKKEGKNAKLLLFLQQTIDYNYGSKRT